MHHLEDWAAAFEAYLHASQVKELEAASEEASSRMKHLEQQLQDARWVSATPMSAKTSLSEHPVQIKDGTCCKYSAMYEAGVA